MTYGFLGMPFDDIGQKAKVAGRSIIQARYELEKRVGDFLKNASDEEELTQRLVAVDDVITEIIARHMGSVSDPKAKLARSVVEEWKAARKVAGPFDVEVPDNENSALRWVEQADTMPEKLRRQRAFREKFNKPPRKPYEYKYESNKQAAPYLCKTCNHTSGQHEPTTVGACKKCDCAKYVEGELAKDASKKASDGQTCSVCGDSITRDPEGEENRTWHHTNGTSHDHEAKPSKESRKMAGQRYRVTVTTDESGGTSSEVVTADSPEQAIERVKTNYNRFMYTPAMLGPGHTWTAELEKQANRFLAKGDATQFEKHTFVDAEGDENICAVCGREKKFYNHTNVASKNAQYKKAKPPEHDNHDYGSCTYTEGQADHKEDLAAGKECRHCGQQPTEKAAMARKAAKMVQCPDCGFQYDSLKGDCPECGASDGVPVEDVNGPEKNSKKAAITPHPEYSPDAWTTPEVKKDIEALTYTSPEQAVKAILAVLDDHGYDSIDREMAFYDASIKLDVDYDVLYNAWLDNPTTAKLAGVDDDNYIVTTGNGTASSLEAYLYNGNVIADIREHDGKTIALIDCNDNTDNGFSAGPQAMRLGSGLWGAETFSDFSAASNKFAEWVDYYANRNLPHNASKEAKTYEEATAEEKKAYDQYVSDGYADSDGHYSPISFERWLTTFGKSAKEAAHGPTCMICYEVIPEGSRNYMVMSDGAPVHKECPKDKKASGKQSGNFRQAFQASLEGECLSCHNDRDLDIFGRCEGCLTKYGAENKFHEDKSKGYDTKEREKKTESCVQKLKAQGHDEASAIRICKDRNKKKSSSDDFRAGYLSGYAHKGATSGTVLPENAPSTWGQGKSEAWREGWGNGYADAVMGQSNRYAGKTAGTYDMVPSRQICEACNTQGEIKVYNIEDQMVHLHERCASAYKDRWAPNTPATVLTTPDGKHITLNINVS